MNSEFSIAVHSLVLLAHRSDRMATSDTIADNVCTHPARVRKVLGILRKQGFVSTREGIGGGYILSCDPEETNLAQVYRAVSMGTLKPGWCSGDPEKVCIIASTVQNVMDDMFQEAELHLEQYWEKWTIADVLRKICSVHKCKETK
ncbi:RrF2 family transcriptional regulator [Gorillibacterium sp. sgz5001074]|uniref:RrF2 family transcriptional regulator n=1 Tax=Gorillibacterium sp. sgz5001074 TaxID=3446695 RepID=UPI003F66454F